MTFTPYATPTDLTDGAWITGQVPDNAVSLLRAATFAVSLATFRNPYDDDAPSADDAPPLRDATCAQVASWIALGVDPAKAGTDLPGPVKKSSILSADVERDTAAQTQAALTAVRDLCRESVDILTVAGLLWVPTPQFDDTGRLPSWGQGVSWWEQFSPWRDPLSGELDYPGQVFP